MAFANCMLPPDASDIVSTQLYVTRVRPTAVTAAFCMRHAHAIGLWLDFGAVSGRSRN